MDSRNDPTKDGAPFHANLLSGCERVPAEHSGNEIEVSPFLKWAGGKRWLIAAHPHLFPTSYNSYFEPFLGSGAVFFHLQPDKAVLSDSNSNLINTYECIKNDWEQVYELLVHHQQCHNKAYYYEMRQMKPPTNIEKAAQFIYLNRTCWNGLYRVNLSGEFNVPIGTKQSVILKNDNFQKIAHLLSNAILLSGDFEECIESAQKGDFVFIDPPYTVKHNNNGFVKYNDNLFNWQDQIRLRDCVARSVARGVKILLTNADHDSVRELYEGVGYLQSLDRSSVISGSALARGRYSELIVKTY